MMRRGPVWSIGGAVIAAVVGFAGPVAGQGVKAPTTVFDDAQIFHPTTDPSRFVSVYDSRNLDPGRFTLGLYGTYAEQPLDFTFEASDEKSADLVPWSAGADLIGAIGLHRRVQLGVDIPYVHVEADRAFNLGALTQTGGDFLGDIRVESKITLLERSPGEGVGFSLLPRIIVPTGDRDRFNNTGKIGGGGLLILDARYRKINYGLNLGGFTHLSDEIRDQLQGGIGITVPAAKYLDVIGEVTGRTEFRGPRSSPVEALLSLRFHRAGLALTIGAGAGVTHGRGAPLFRVIAGLTPYVPEKEILPPLPDLVTNSRKAWRLADDTNGDSRPNPSEQLEYTITLVNSGTADAEEVVFVDPIPEHSSYVPGSLTLGGTALSDGADADAGDYNASNPGAITVKLGTIGFTEPNDSITFSFRVQIDPNLVDITVIRNQATVFMKANPDAVAAAEAAAEGDPGLLDRLFGPKQITPTETTVFPSVRERETVVVTPEKLELTRNIHFEFNKAVIRRESFKILDDVAGVLKDNPGLNILIEGHTDAVGSVGYNQKLSEKRAAAVRQYLISKGTAGARLATDGKGKLHPIASNDTSIGRALNRRVEFLIVNPEVVKTKRIEKKPFIEDITPESEPPGVTARYGAGVGGASGDRATVEAQEALRKIGYLSRPSTGIMNAETRAALERFQRENGLPVTGAPDAVTRKALDEAIELQRSSR